MALRRRCTRAITAAIRSHQEASEGVKRLQEKSSGLLTLVLTLAPLAAAGAGAAFAFASEGHSTGWVGGGFLVLSVILLALAALNAFLGAGSISAGALNMSRMSDSPNPSLVTLKAAEADAWQAAVAIAMDNAQRRALDLFAARRFLVLAVLSGTIGSAMLVGLIVQKGLSSPTSSQTPSPIAQTDGGTRSASSGL